MFKLSSYHLPVLSFLELEQTILTFKQKKYKYINPSTESLSVRIHFDRNACPFGIQTFPKDFGNNHKNG